MPHKILKIIKQGQGEKRNHSRSYDEAFRR